MTNLFAGLLLLVELFGNGEETRDSPKKAWGRGTRDENV